jgi:ribosomal protein S12 methylthiotransferase accessory factor
VGGCVRTTGDGDLGEGDLLIAGCNAADLERQLATQYEAKEAGARLLRVAWSSDHLWIGPLVEAGQDGCIQCFNLWTSNDWSRKIAGRLAHDPSLMAGWSEPFRAAAAAAVAEAALTGMTSSTALFLSTDFRDWSRHSFIRHPQCDRCAPLPDDAPEAALALSEPGAASAAGSFRTLSLAELEQIVAIGVDSRCGLVRSVSHDTPSMLFPMAHAVLSPDRRPTSIEVGVGRTGSRRRDAAVSVLEGIERFAGLRPCGRTTRVEGSYSELKDRAVDPRHFILHEPGSHDEPGFGLAPYSPATRYSWVWAYSFRRACSVLVPEQLAYYGSPKSAASGPRFVSETSNGCAIGGSIEEAVLHGLFEVIERDAFLANWYAGRPVPRVDTSAIEDELIRALLSRCRAHEFEVEVLDLRAGLPTPVFAVSLMNRTRNDQPALALAAGAHLDPLRALQGALVEGISALANRDPARAAARLERGRALLAQPELVQVMADHTDQCWPAEAIGTRDFTRSCGPDLQWDRSFGASADVAASLGTALVDLIGAVLAIARDVIVVDLSFEPFRTAGLRCVKVLAPGLLPMTFGHQYRRISEDRLRALASDPPADHRAAGFLPHPFP